MTRNGILVAALAALAALSPAFGADPAGSLAQIRAAQALVRQGDLAGAKAAYDKIAATPEVPEHLRWEARECLREIERQQAGQPARDPAASRTPLPKRPAPGLVLHVAPGGADANPGTSDKPFATLARARDEIRGVKRKGGLPPGGVAVLIHGGEYTVAETLKLNAEDSGTEAGPIIYRAADGEAPRLTGGVRLSGFQPVQDPAVRARLPEEARDNVVCVDLRKHGVTDLQPLSLGGFCSGRGFRTHPLMELYCDEKAMPLSRWPNEGDVSVADVRSEDAAGGKTWRIVYEGDRPSRWKDEKNILLYGYWFYDWADSYEQVSALDTDKHEITLAPPFSTYSYKKGQHYCAVNLLSEIDSSGEWYLDHTTGLLYWYPPTDPANAVVELSVMKQPFIEMDNVAHVVLQGLLCELGGGDGIVVKGGERCLLTGCTVRRFGGNGVVIDGKGHGVLSCDISLMGRGGIVASGGDRKTLTPGGLFIENCHIHDLSRIDHTYTPAVMMTGVGHRIAHNLMHDIRSSAINLTGNDHLVEFNEIFRVVQESDDQGGVDMFGNPTFRGNVYRYNYFHHVGNWQHPGDGPGCGRAGIRLDDAISGVLIYGNVFYRASAGKLGFGGVQIHGGKDNILDNNIFVDCMAAISFSPWGDKRWRDYTAKTMDALDIDRALYLQRYPELARLSEDHDVNHIWRSVVCRCTELTRRDAGRAQFLDKLVTNDDPGFVDAGQGNFQLKDATKVSEQIGFRPIPFDEIGLYRDDFRKDLPAHGSAATRAAEESLGR